jgi:hypothetical protein
LETLGEAVLLHASDPLLLLPWNRTEPFSVNMLLRTVMSPPRSGRFNGGRGPAESA